MGEFLVLSPCIEHVERLCYHISGWLVGWLVGCGGWWLVVGGLVWFGLVWFGLVWFGGLVGLVWFGLVVGLGWVGLVDWFIDE